MEGRQSNGNLMERLTRRRKRIKAKLNVKTRNDSSVNYTFNNCPIATQQCTGNQVNYGEPRQGEYRSVDRGDMTSRSRISNLHCVPSTSRNDQDDQCDGQDDETNQCGQKSTESKKATRKRKITTELPQHKEESRERSYYESAKDFISRKWITDLTMCVYFIDIQSEVEGSIPEKQTLDKALVRQLALEEDKLDSAALNYIRCRKTTVDLIRKTADQLMKSYTQPEISDILAKPPISKLLESGLITAFFSILILELPSKLPLLIFVAVYFFLHVRDIMQNKYYILESSNETRLEFRKVIQQDNSACNDLIEALRNIDTTVKKLREMGYVTGCILSVQKPVFRINRDVNKLTKLGSMTYETEQESGETQIKKPSAFGKGPVDDDAAFTVIQVPLEMYDVMYDEKRKQRNAPQLSQSMHTIAERLDCPSKEETRHFLNELKGSQK